MTATVFTFAPADFDAAALKGLTEQDAREVLDLCGAPIPMADRDTMVSAALNAAIDAAGPGCRDRIEVKRDLLCVTVRNGKVTDAHTEFVCAQAQLGYLVSLDVAIEATCELQTWDVQTREVIDRLSFDC